MEKITLTILGAPGSGKGTQAKILAKKFGLIHIEIGNLIRELIKKDIEARQRYNQGIPQPDKLMEKILNEKISNFSQKKIIIDPFPLTVGQIEILNRLIKKYELAKPTTIYLKTDSQAVYERMMKRGEGRGDDDPKIAQKRIKIYQKTLAPVISKLKNEGSLLEIDGNPSIPTVTREILKELSKNQ